MLPNLRLLLTATLSTFLLTAAAGLFVSLRLAQEPLTMRSDTRAAFDEKPINRISLSWSPPEPARAAALRDLPPPANSPALGRDQAVPAINAPHESGVAELAKSEPQVASGSEELVEPKPATAETPGINSGGDQPAPAPPPEVTGAIGELAQSTPAPGANAKLASLPPDSRPQASKAQSKKRVMQRKRAHRLASRQFRLLTPRRNTAAPFLFFGPPSSP